MLERRCLIDQALPIRFVRTEETCNFDTVEKLIALMIALSINAKFTNVDPI
jgi:hypothetical protein